MKEKVILKIFICIILFGCNENSNKRKEYYETGELKTIGQYISDSIPIDTTFEYYKDGKLKSITVYDSSGRKNGECSLFFENGKVRQVQSYYKNYLNGLVKDYSSKGLLISQTYFKGNKKIGEAEFYSDSNGSIELYNFFDFNSQNLIVREYSNQKLSKSLGNDFIVDTVLNNKDTLLSNNEFLSELLIAHIPHTSVEVKALSFDCYGKVKDSLPIRSEMKWQLLNIPISNGICEIWIKGEQYDSVSLKSNFIILKHILK